MRTSLQGRKLITSHEGEILEVYKDPIGLPTVGVGHLVTASERKKYPLGKKITKAESQRLLAEDLRDHELGIEVAVTAPLNQNQFDALVSLSFNIGKDAFKRSSVRKRLNALNYEGAADAFLVWNKAGGRILPGLVRRRKEERDLFLTPIKDSPAVQETALPFVSSPSVDPSDNPSVHSDLPQANFLDRITTPILSVRDKFNALGVDPSSISKSSAITTLATKAMGWPMLILGFINDNLHFLIIGAVLVVVAIWYFNHAKTRANMRSIRA